MKTKILLFVGTNKEFGEYLKELRQLANTDLTEVARRDEFETRTAIERRLMDNEI